MNEIQIFSNPNFGEIRVTGTPGKPMFCLADVCKALDIKNVSDCKSRLNQKGVGAIDTLTKGGMQSITFINEGNLYKCIFRSRKAEANQFQDWVTDEVLPSIRKTGGYIATNEDDSPETIMARAIIIAQETINRQKNQIATLDNQNKQLVYTNEQQKQEISSLTPDAEYTRTTLSAQNTWNTNVCAKDMGMSAVTLNKKLHNLGIQYKQHGTWILTAPYQDKGYTKMRTITYTGYAGETRTNMQMEWTEAGRRFLYDLHKKGRI